MNVRPLPEEEELEDELFAGASEAGNPGNENTILFFCIATVTNRTLNNKVFAF